MTHAWARRVMTGGFVLLAASAPVLAHPSDETKWNMTWVEEVAHGDSHLISLEYARAIDAYEAAIKKGPQAVIPHLRVASAAYRWADAVPARRSDIWPLALKMSERARFLDPFSAEAAFLSGIIRYRMGDYEGAVAAYQALEKVREGDINLYLDLALAAKRMGDAQLARRALDRARAINPSAKRLYSVAREVLAAG